MRRSALLLAGFAASSVLAGFASDAFGHAHLISPMRRANCQSGDDTSCKPASGAGPCGGTPNPAVTATTYVTGSQVTLTWAETVNHASTYRLSISTSGVASQTNFDSFIIMADGTVADQAGATLNFTWTVPASTGCSTSCVMQLIQDMDTNPATIANPYYNCADIKIVAAGVPTPTPTGTDPDPTPTPGDPAEGDPIEIDAYGACTIAVTRVSAGVLAPLALLALTLLRRRRAR